MKQLYHSILISISTTKSFTSQRQMAEFLGIKNSSKKAIAARCRVSGFGVIFDEYEGEYNVSPPWQGNEYLVTDIEFDTDGLDVSLPKEMTVFVPKDITDGYEVNEYISDKITEETGYCHKGFSLTPEIDY